ncbi:uncharacterized protein BP5553_08386 [Venustampulla echinocandica]|uniref:Uncharacterized protein n=1 Tax=Venustampulla echinocandica TaxID=2656787 RepID=A0A370TE26_9HELO|nr:uncharacterized protein BP5553_08386 [Venustampulla echinocandica]RDL32947.1 hypothetical protein BP5553_08386 [Venustampulla echinocandica]
MKFLSVLIPLALLSSQTVHAANWYFLRWNTPSSSAQFQKFSMQMVTPTIQKAGVYYLWPGLQDTGNTGVYQEVLDGRSGTWWIGPGWCCSNPSLPWGDGFNPGNGKAVDITMTRDASGPNWTSILTSGSNSVTNKFPLSYKNFNQVMNTTQTAWCTNAPENYNNAMRYTISGAKATVSGGTTTCQIDQVVMEGPR